MLLIMRWNEIEIDENALWHCQIAHFFGGKEIPQKSDMINANNLHKIYHLYFANACTQIFIIS